MKACDRCLPKLVPSVEEFNLTQEGSVIDLCEKCKNEVLQFIHSPPNPEKRSILSLGKRKQNSAKAEDRSTQ